MSLLHESSSAKGLQCGRPLGSGAYITCAQCLERRVQSDTVLNQLTRTLGERCQPAVDLPAACQNLQHATSEATRTSQKIGLSRSLSLSSTPSICTGVLADEEPSQHSRCAHPLLSSGREI